MGGGGGGGGGGGFGGGGGGGGGWGDIRGGGSRESCSVGLGFHSFHLSAPEKLSSLWFQFVPAIADDFVLLLFR